MVTRRAKRNKQNIQLVNRKTGGTTSKQPRFQATEGAPNPQSFFISTLKWVSTLIEEEPEYNVNSMMRDSWLSKIWRSEPHLAGVLNSVVSIDTNRGWSLEGGRNQVLRYTNIFHTWEAAPGAQGWRPGMSNASLSYYYTDLGGVVELGRDEVDGPVRGLYHVDSTRCIMNGDVETPLTYSPLIYGSGAAHEQDWAKADYIRMASMISTSEALNGLGYCAVSRCLELAKIMVAIYEHDREQLGAKAPKGLLMLNGITETQWDDSMEARAARLKGGDYEYFDAVQVLAGQGAENISAELIALSQLPANFNMQEFTSMLMYGYALCFGYDPSEFYPVQFGALGRGTEMEVQHEKATGKGGLNYILAIQEQLQRPDVLPASLKFEFDQRDEASEIEEAAAQEAWANLFKTVRETGIDIDGVGGVNRTEYRMLLADHNIIPKEWTEVEEDIEVTDEDASQSGLGKPAIGEEAEPTPVTPLLEMPSAIVQSKQRRILRDKLLSQPHIWRAIQRFPHEDIIKYRWKSGLAQVETCWEEAVSLLDRISFGSVDRKSKDNYYESNSVTISKDDVDLALAEAEEIDENLSAIMKAQAFEVKL